MKKYIAIALTFVLTAALFAGCRRRTDPAATSTPTVGPTVELPTREPTQAPATAPTVPSTVPTVPETTEMTGSTESTDTTVIPDGTGTDTARSGRRIPGGR